MVEKFMTMFEQSNSARIVAESKAASEQARADVLQSQLDQLQGTAADGGRPSSAAAAEASTDGLEAKPGDDDEFAREAQAAEAAAPSTGRPTPAKARKGFLARAWAAWVYLIESQVPD